MNSAAKVRFFFDICKYFCKIAQKSHPPSFSKIDGFHDTERCAPEGKEEQELVRFRLQNYMVFKTKLAIAYSGIISTLRITLLSKVSI